METTRFAFLKSARGFFLAEAGAAGLLLLAVFLGWSWGSGIWSASDWQRPTAYGDLVRSDVLQHLAFIKAARDGHFVPFASKTVPELGAPGVANWNDWPIAEEVPIALMGVAARAVGLFAALNAFLLAGHLLAALVFYGVARVSEVTRLWAWVGGVAYGLAPFLFAQSPHHPLVQWCWHVPLFLLAWGWVATEPGVRPGGRRFWAGIGIGALAGGMMVYYAAIFALLVLAGAVIGWLRARNAANLVSAAAMVGATALTFAAMNLDTWMFQAQHGANPGALVRPYQWVEVYGMGVVNWFVPLPEHAWDWFRALAERHGRNRVLADEGSYFGLVGLAALVLLVGVAVRALVRRDPQGVPIGAWQILGIGVVFVPGGLNALAGVAGFTLLRTGCRYSVVVLAIALLFAAQWMSRRRLRGWWAAGIAGGLTVLVLLDQVPRSPTDAARQEIAAEVASDRDYVAALESALPKGAAVFLIPAMEFPEAPLPGMSPSENFRSYLHSSSLRFSFGNNKGRGAEDWQKELTTMSLPGVLAELRRRGFSAVSINRAGFEDGAEGLLAALAAQGWTRRIESPRKDLVAVLPPGV